MVIETGFAGLHLQAGAPAANVIKASNTSDRRVFRKERM
jgi:hypothetical protein